MGNYTSACSGKPCRREDDGFHDAKSFGKRRENIKKGRDKAKNEKCKVLRQIT